MISKISSRVGATRIFVVRPGGGVTPTPTPTSTITPTPTSTPTNTPTPTLVVYYYYYLRDCNQTHNKIGRSLTSGLSGITYSDGNGICYEIVGLDLGPTFDYDLDILINVDDCTSTLCLAPTPTPTSTPTPTVTPSPTPTIFIPENDLVYILIPNDDLTYTLIPSNDLIGTFIPDSDLLYTLIPNGDLNYILLPDNDLNGIDIPLNDVNYTLIPNSDLTYTLIPNNDIEYSVLKPPTVFYGEIKLGEDSVEGTCNCSVGECPRFYVTGDGPTFCDSNIFVITGGGTFFNGWGTIVHNGFYKTVNMDGGNVATYRTDCGTCPTTPTPTETPTPTSTETPTPTPTETPTPTPTETETPTPTPTETETPTPTPTSTETPTPTPTETPTPTPTESPLDFTISSDCVNGGAIYTNNHIGGSGVYDRGSGLYDTELEALNETGWFQIMNPINTVSNSVPYFNTTRTYWVALRDRNNPSNIIVKSVLVDCEPTPTPTPIPTETPTPTPTETSTPTPTPTLPPLNFTISSNCNNNGSITFSNLVGVASGQYQYSNGVFTTESGALNSVSWVNIPGGSSGLLIPAASGTYWLAVRDANNPSYVIAKSVTISCVVTSNLILHYDPSNTSSYPGTGTTITDLSGGGRNGTMSNITHTSPYFTYNGTSSQISIPDDVVLEPGISDWTIEVWVNQSVAGNDVILGKFNSGGQTQNVGYSIRTLGSSVYAQYGSGSGSGTLLFQNSASYTITPGTWYQIVYVFTNVASNTFETFVNGTSIGSISHSLSSILNTSTNLYIGSYNNGEYDQWFDGKIGITRLYNKSLSASEVLQNFNTSKSKYGL